MADKGFELLISKTLAIMLTSKRGYVEPRFFLEGKRIKFEEHIRYLGVELSRILGFGKHVE